MADALRRMAINWSLHDGQISSGSGEGWLTLRHNNGWILRLRGQKALAEFATTLAEALRLMGPLNKIGQDWLSCSDACVHYHRGRREITVIPAPGSKKAHTLSADMAGDLQQWLALITGCQPAEDYNKQTSLNLPSVNQESIVLSAHDCQGELRLTPLGAGELRNALLRAVTKEKSVSKINHGYITLQTVRNDHCRIEICWSNGRKYSVFISRSELAKIALALDAILTEKP